MSKLIVIVKMPRCEAFVTQIHSGLESMQAVVGGMIEKLPGVVVDLPAAVDIWFNEEGKLENLPPNLWLLPGHPRSDVLLGTVFFASHNNRTSRTLSLPKRFHAAVLAFCQTHAWKDATS